MNAGTVVVLRQGLNGYSGTEDTALFQDYAGNSAGGFPYIFSGKNRFNSARRSLIKFNLQNNIPAPATITTASLSLYIEFDNSGNVLNALHRMTRAWNEGVNPMVDVQTIGQGAPAQAGDSTWSHVSSSAVTWATPGGEFVVTASAVAVAGNPGTFVRFTGLGLVSDVQAWVSQPSGNYGWALLGGESAVQTAKRFYSSEAEAAFSSLRPELLIEYETLSAVSDWTIY